MKPAGNLRLPIVFALLLSLPATAQAGVRLGGTRVVYLTDQPEVTLSVENTGKAPVLVQAWITDIDQNDSSGNSDVPFVMTPPVFRLQPHTSQSLRIRHLSTGDTSNRERAYWLNVYEIPGQDVSRPAANLLEIATRTRIKLFLRPHTLKEPAAAAAEKLRWHVAGTASAQPSLVVTNPTPYHVNFGELGVLSGQHRIPRSGGDGRGGMVAPFATRAFPIESVHATGAAKAYAKVINDHGGMRALEWPLADRSGN